MSTYQIKAGAFEGPLGVLLSLVEAKKLHISEVSLASVTQDFLQYISDHKDSLDESSLFISVAATLMLIKARSLVPTLTITEEETEAIEELQDRLVEFEIVQKAAKALSGIAGITPLHLHPYQQPEPVFAPHESITLSAIVTALRAVTEVLPTPEAKLPQARLKHTIRIEDVLERIQAELSRGARVSLGDTVRRARETLDPIEHETLRMEAIVTFLAMLELVRSGVASIVQNEAFGEVAIDAKPPEV